MILHKINASLIYADCRINDTIDDPPVDFILAALKPPPPFLPAALGLERHNGNLVDLVHL